MQKKFHIIWMILVTTLLFPSCATHVRLSSERVVADLFQKLVLYPSFMPDYYPKPEEIAGTKIEKAWMDGDVLVVQFQHADASQYSFDLRYNGNYMKSKPMKLDLFLFSEIVNPLETKVQKTLRFNVKELLPPGDDKLFLRLQGYSGELVLERK